MSMRFDRYASLLFLVVGLAFVLESRKISESAYGSNVGPDMFPLGLGLILILLSLRLFYETFRYQLKEASKSTQDYKSFLILLGSSSSSCLGLDRQYVYR